MNCPRCNASLPDGARFCLNCGASMAPAAPPPPAPPVAPAPGPAVPTVLNCPSCGAPIHPTFGDMVLTCEYCGGSVSLGGAGWKGVGRHTMLLPKITTADAAAPIVQRYLDQGFLHRKAYEESNLLEQKLSFVPFWIVPTSATTNYSYTDVAVGIGSTVGSIAAAELLGNALGGGRSNVVAIPFMTGSPVNSTRQATVTGQYEFPVVAVRSLSAYQPKNYQFHLEERIPFDRKQVPGGAPVLNGDLGEDAAAHTARSYVTQLQTDLAHKKHAMVSKLACDVQVSDAELLHAPIWYFTLERKGQKTIVLIDSHAGEIMQVVGG